MITDKADLVGGSIDTTFASYPHTSATFNVLGLNTISFCVSTAAAVTFSIYKSSNQEGIDGVLFFQKELSADELFTKRIPVVSNFMYYTIDSSATPDNIKVQLYAHRDAGFNASTFTNSSVPINENASLVRNVNDFKMDLIRGLHTDFEKINIAGNVRLANEVATNGSVIGFQADVFNYDSTAEDLYYTGTDANDTFGGTGAQQLKVEYNDSNNDRAEFVLATGGAVGPIQITDFAGDPVPASAVERMSVVSAGSNLANFGTITLSDSVGNVYNVLHPGENISRSVLFRVPRNKSLVISDMSINGYSQISGVVNLILSTQNITNPNDEQIKKPIGRFRITTQANQYTYHINANVAAGEFICAEFVPDSAPGTTNTIDISISMNAMLCPTINAF